MTCDQGAAAASLPGFVRPEVDHDSAPFWASLRDRRLVVQRCTGCRTLRWPFRSVCAVCRGRECTEETMSGDGTLYSWTVIHHATVPTPPALLPYCVALVALAEDPRILIPAQYDGPRGELCSGLPVTAAYHDVTDDLTVLHWRRRGERGERGLGERAAGAP